MLHCLNWDRTINRLKNSKYSLFGPARYSLAEYLLQFLEKELYVIFGGLKIV